jgi:hypothetical protein
LKKINKNFFQIISYLTYDDEKNKTNIFDCANNKIQKKVQYDNLEKYYQESNELKSNRIENNNSIND